MKISDLKSGKHIVKLRNGDICMVFGENIVDKTEHLALREYRENMKAIGHDCFDIVDVYEIKGYPVSLICMLDYFDTQVEMIKNNELHPIWERTEKIELTDAERVILENIDKTYQWIARDKEGLLCVFSDKPTKHEDEYWYFDDDANCDFFSIAVFQHIFQSIQWEDDDPKYIPDLLKNTVAD